MVFVDENGNEIDIAPDQMIYVPERLLRIISQQGGGQGGGGQGGGGGITTFAQLKEKILDNPVLANPYDCLMRNQLRLSYWNQIQKFGALNSLLGKNAVFLQLVLTDENRDIQEKMYQGLNRQNPVDPNVVAERSRYFFKALVPYLLEDTKRWVFSRSMVMKEYKKSLLDETLWKLLPYDPVGGLNDVPYDLPLGTPESEVAKQHNALMERGVKAYKDTPVPLGIRCTEVLMFIAGDFGLDDGGLNSREAVQKLLRELTTEDGVQKIQGFDEMTAGCRKVSPEKIAVLKDLHFTA